MAFTVELTVVVENKLTCPPPQSNRSPKRTAAVLARMRASEIWSRSWWKLVKVVPITIAEQSEEAPDPDDDVTLITSLQF